MKCVIISRSIERDPGIINEVVDTINQELNGRYNGAGYVIGRQHYDTNFIVAKAG